MNFVSAQLPENEERRAEAVERTGLIDSNQASLFNIYCELVKEIKLPSEYFAEGITILNDKIFQLTWKEKVGFVYDIDNFNRIDSFEYKNSIEGWGICNDGNKLYKSDGTDKIWILNPENQKEESYIEIYTNKNKVVGLNELEWIDGKIYANRYLFDGIAIINPKNGAIEGVINLSSIHLGLNST